MVQSSEWCQQECGWETCIQTIQHQCLQFKYKQNNGEHTSLKHLSFSSLTLCIWFPWFLKRHKLRICHVSPLTLAEHFRISHHHQAALVIMRKILTQMAGRFILQFASFYSGISTEELERHWIISPNPSHHSLPDTVLCFVSVRKKTRSIHWLMAFWNC